MSKFFHKKYILKSPIKIARISRLFAKSLDLFIVLLLCAFFYPLGIIAAIFYMGICDSLQGGQSIGKRFIGMVVVSLEDGRPCSLKQSFIRNLPIIVPLFFILIPLWGWVFSIFSAIPLLTLEVYLLFKLDSGHRLGDVMADTTVIANKFKDEKTKREAWVDQSKVGYPVIEGQELS